MVKKKKVLDELKHLAGSICAHAWSPVHNSQQTATVHSKGCVHVQRTVHTCGGRTTTRGNDVPLSVRPWS